MSRRKKSAVGDLSRHQRRLWEKWQRRVHLQVKRLREDNELTHREFGARLGVTGGTSIRWGSGKTMPDLPVLLDMMRQFKLPPAYFFDV